MMRIRHSTAFTLVELLVVVTIIAVLAAMLLPALQKSRESAKTAACISNQKQIVMACLLYADEHAGQLPNGDDYAGTRSESWVLCIMPYLSGKPNKAVAVLACPVGQTQPLTSGYRSIGVQWPNIFGHQVDAPLVTTPSRYVADLPPGTMLTGDDAGGAGLIAGPRSPGNAFGPDCDGDKVPDSRDCGHLYNGLVFLHQGRAVVGCADGSARAIVVLQWARNDSNLWGP